ncbi:aldolase/citrate lyase family protein [Undibacterium sp. Jales W-56]|uniref:HpcH/HpaI aldolase/citrate lyase family protein n=1 Tax=Undibacterium sp. Jales W-56 TaxID=2897325 RepID=UPI0021CFC080|nr:aldolase/citrate lyase family protein [Undibacterium sp. Jales W-56]MCU6433472.1 aldolase/citrate lyase family protein [Undibacterium sp. Jales W-56]
MHPSQVLFQDQQQPVLLPVCDHYAGSEKLMHKSISLQNDLGPVFDITFDCEDGAAAGNEAAHARLVAALIASEQNQFQRIGVRVHDVDSPYFEQDIALIAPIAADKLAYLVLPKVSDAGQVRQAIDSINQHFASYRSEPVPVHVLIETHDALAQAHQIAALSQVACLSFGIMDFVSAHYGAIPSTAMRSPGQFTHPLVMRAKLEIAAACHRFGKVASHNVTTEIKDTAIVAGDATRAIMECGYTRMWSIHPDQIKPIIKALTPRSAEINEAISILSAAQQKEWGPIQFNGRLHDRASYRYYWTLLKRAQQSQIALPEQGHALI